MTRASSGPIQGQLFGSGSAVERFRFDETTKMISRIVTLRDADAASAVSEIGRWEGHGIPDDLRKAADLTYLRRRERPSVADGSKVRVVDLFSGCGAMGLGVAEACRAVGRRFVPAGALDVSQRVLDVFSHNFDTSRQPAVDLAEVLSGNLEDSPRSQETELLARLGHVDFVVAGPPCQGHSNLNNFTRRNDPKNALYFLVARFAKLFLPRWIVIENVMAVLHDKNDVVHRTQDALENLGYETADGIVDLWTIGVAQTRRRHVLVAQLRSHANYGPRELPYLADMIAPYATRARSVRWAIEDLLDVHSHSVLDAPRNSDEITRTRIDYLFDHDIHTLPKSHRPESHKGKNGETYKSVYGRMYWEEPAPTITGGFATMGQGRFVHPKRRRTITAHEAARIQFIPDFFDFKALGDNRSAIAEAIGNAVPPKLSFVIALELLR